MVLGDSISAGYGIPRESGWVALLAQTLIEHHAPWQVINASISGETTGGGLARLPGVLEAHKPQLVIIELGGNDGLRGYPTSKMAANLTAMVDMVRDAGAFPVLMSMRIPPNYGPRYTRAFEAAFEDVSDAADIPLIPFFLADVAVRDGMMQADGIHPTAAAQPLMQNLVWQFIEPLLDKI